MELKNKISSKISNDSVDFGEDVTQDANFDIDRDLASVERFKTPDYNYRWVRAAEVVGGEDRRGWKPDPSGIVSQGMVFCRMPKTLAERKKKQIAEKTRARTEAIRPQNIASQIGHGADPNLVPMGLNRND